jgi:nucleoside-diphosphate-sugar epimerase
MVPVTERVLVVGASGALGRIIATKLAERGALVRGFPDRSQQAGFFEPGQGRVHGAGGETDLGDDVEPIAAQAAGGDEDLEPGDSEGVPWSGPPPW